MKQKINTGLRILLGLIFVIFGLNFFLQFIPMPPPSEQMGAFMGALFATGYFFYVLKVVEIVFGALLVVGLFVPLSLTVLAPVVVNIFLAHVFLDPSGLPMGITLMGLNIYLAYVHRDAFKALFRK